MKIYAVCLLKLKDRHSVFNKQPWMLTWIRFVYNIEVPLTKTMISPKHAINFIIPELEFIN